MSTAKPVLTYFNGRGLAEYARLLFAELKIDYVDNRISEDELKALKGTDRLHFDQVPILEIDDFRLSQSMTIARYIARKNGLYGSNEEEAARCDEVVDGVRDLNTARGNARTDEDKAKFKSETFARHAGFLERLLKKNNNGQGFFVGNNLTYADLVAFNGLDACIINLDFPAALNQFPLLKAFYERIAARPNIAAWIAARPVTPW